MNLVLLLSLLFAGFLVNVASITPALRWVHYLSVFFYGFEALTTNELSGINLTFTARAVGCVCVCVCVLVAARGACARRG